MKRMNVEIADEDYLYLKNRASREGQSVVALIRQAVAALQRADAPDVRSDPMYKVGSFDGLADLAEHHDGYLYGSR
ncbi:MAG: hypothetical protein WDA71_02105 [Actinomycetota bacterium]